MTPNRRTDQAEPSDCPRTCLAENGVGRVEVCRCGMWQVHIGALTLRFAECGATGLLSLLEEAMARHAARRFELTHSTGLSPGRAERGEA